MRSSHAPFRLGRTPLSLLPYSTPFVALQICLHLPLFARSAERLARCWGSGAGFKFDETKDSIRSMLQVGGWSQGFLATNKQRFRGACLARRLALVEPSHCANCRQLKREDGNGVPGNRRPLARVALHMRSRSIPNELKPLGWDCYAAMRRSMRPAATRRRCGASCATWRCPSSTTNL